MRPELNFKLNRDAHYGREIHTTGFFWKKQKAIYPIIALVSLGCCYSIFLSCKNLFFNKSVVFSRKNITLWNRESSVDIDPVTKLNLRPEAKEVIPKSSEL